MRAPVIYINLASDEVRRSQMESEFERLGVRAERFDAVRWTDLPQKDKGFFYSDSLNNSTFHAPLLSGEKGCYLSHIRVWEDLLKSDHSAVVVLEDDVRLSDQFRQVIGQIESLEMQWDMIKLIGRSEEKVRRSWRLNSDFDLIDYSRVPSLTAGYVVSRSGAQKLINSRIPFGRPIDVDLRHWWENDMIILGVKPSVVLLEPTSLVSSIGERNRHKSSSVRAKKFFLKLKMTALNALHSVRKRSTESF